MLQELFTEMKSRRVCLVSWDPPKSLEALEVDCEQSIPYYHMPVGRNIKAG